MIKISVLMSVYIKEESEYLKKSIQSLLEQTRKPDQIVIVKDGKLTQQLDNVIDNFKMQFPNIIDVIGIEKNIGLGKALNYGIQFCKYEYVARMDSDDISPINRFELQEKYFEKHPEIDILGGYIEEYDEEFKRLISIRKVPLDDKNIKEKMKLINPFNHGTVIYKKDVVINAGNYKNVKLEDYDLWARLAVNNCKMANLDEVLCLNRTGRSMYKRRSGKRYIQAIMEIEKKLLEYKIINKREYFTNISRRIILAICPIKLKEIIYPKIVRKIG